ncbi:hypothetical protein N7528_002415 [Penicillium herquei]|nr:hypothetical protein N7528_002415 [Penicillium herquei]
MLESRADWESRVLDAEGDLKPINGIETSLQMRTARNNQLGDFPLQIGQSLGDGLAFIRGVLMVSPGMLNTLHGIDIGLLVLCRCRRHGVDIHFIGVYRNITVIDQWDLVRAADLTGDIRIDVGDNFVELFLAQSEETPDLIGTIPQIGGINLAASLSLSLGRFELFLKFQSKILGIPELIAESVVSSSVEVQLTFQLSNSDGQELLSCQVRRCHVGQGFLLAALIKRGRSGRELLTASAYVADAQDGSDQQRTHRNENAAENHLVHGDQ